MAKLIVDEIMIGERNGAHAVLAASTDESFAQSLARHLDLPDQIPPGFTFNDYVSGFPYKDRYVIARTSPDHTACRPGMVFSHAVVMTANDAAAIDDVSGLLKRLCRTRPPSPATERFSSNTNVATKDMRPYPGIARGLANGNSPVVVSDTDLLESAVVYIWPSLPAALRPRFRFRLSFGPDDVEQNPADLVAAPTSMAMRWSAGALVEDPFLADATPTAAAQLLSGSPDPRFAQFLKDLELPIDSFRLLSRVDKAWQRYHQRPATFTSTLTALRLVASLQPSSDRATTYKRELVQRFESEVAPHGPADILQLRNLDILPLGNIAPLRQTLSAGIRTLLTNRTDYDHVEPVISSAFDESRSVPFWRSAFDDALSAIEGADLNPFSCLLWDALSHSADHGVFLIDRGPAATSLDPVLAQTLPLDGAVSHDLLSSRLLERDLPLAEAALLTGHYKNDLNEALKHACERKNGRHAPVAVKHILKNMDSDTVLSAAATINHSAVREHAVDVAAKTPSLLAGLDFGIANYQSIWAEAITRNTEAWNIGSQVRQTADKLFSAAIHNNGRLEESLVKAFATTPLANLIDHPDRSAIWSVLPTTLKQPYLETTTAAWIERLSVNPDSVHLGQLEPDLAATLSKLPHQQSLIGTFNRIPFATVLELYSTVDDLPESAFRNVFISVVHSSNELSHELIEQSARLMLTRGWKQTTRTLLSECGVSATLKPLFEICAVHLDLWTRFSKGITQPTGDDIHALLTTVATTLYSRGPLDQAIWTRAGGDESDLDLSGNGQAQWSFALNRIRCGGSVRVQNLLTEMRNDFPYNLRLQYLQKATL